VGQPAVVGRSRGRRRPRLAGRASRRSRVWVSASLTVAEQRQPSWLVSLQAGAVARLQSRSCSPRPTAIMPWIRSAPGHRPALRRGTLYATQSAQPGRCARRARPRRPGPARPPLGTTWLAITARELSDTPLVTRASGSGTRDYLTAALRNLLGPGTGETAPRLELSTSAAVRAAVLTGSAPAVLRRLAVSDDSPGAVCGGAVQRARPAARSLWVWLGRPMPPAGAVPICSVTSDRSRSRVISGCARPDLEPRAFTAGCTPGPWPAGPRREWLTGLAAVT